MSSSPESAPESVSLPLNLTRRLRPMLGTFVEIAVDCDSESMIAAGFAAIAMVQARMSFHESSSDLAALRRAKIGAVLAIDPASVEVLKTAETLYRASGGLFDVTIGRALVQSGFLPTRFASGETLGDLSLYDGTAGDIEILDDRHVRLHRRVLIDLGGIAKGYAVDCAVAALRAAGVVCGIVNAGGDIFVFGEHCQPVEVRLATGRLSAPVMLAERAMASSENSRTRRRLGRRIVTPHIARGAWSQGGRDQHKRDRDERAILCDQTVSVVAAQCMIADALTKIAMSDDALATRILEDHDGYIVRHSPAHDSPAQDSPAQDSPAQDSSAQDSSAQDSSSRSPARPFRSKAG